MRKLLLVGLAVMVLAGFGVCGWQLQQAHERETALTKRIEALEKSAKTSSDGTQAMAQVTLGVASRTGKLESQVSDLQRATFGFGVVSTRGSSLESRIDALEVQSGDPYTAVTDNSAQVTQLQMRLDRLCSTIRLNSSISSC